MNNRLAVYALDRFDTYDQEILVELIKKKYPPDTEPTSVASGDLLAYLRSDRLLEVKFQQIINYVSQEANWNLKLYGILKSAIIKITKAKSNPNENLVVTRPTHYSPAIDTTDEAWLLSDVENMDESLKKKIVLTFEMHLRLHGHGSVFPSVYSHVLQKTILNTHLSFENKWTVMMDYCRQKHNVNRRVFDELMRCMTDVIDRKCDALIAEKHYSEAFNLIKKFNKNGNRKLLKESILHGCFQTTYAEKYDFSKEAYLKTFYLEEIIRKTTRDLNNTPGSNASHFRGYFMGYEMLLRTPAAFFAQQRRTFITASQFQNILGNLSQLSSLLNPSDKLILMQAIVAIYEDSLKLSQSHGSKKLVKTIKAKPIAIAWAAMVDFIVSDKDLVFINNGSRLFHIIKDQTQAAVNGIFDENRYGMRNL